MTTTTPSARAVALLTTEWDEVCTNLQFYAADLEDAGYVYWAARIRETYAIIRQQMGEAD